MNEFNNYIKIYNELNADQSHMLSEDDICTPMECVKLMIDYIPDDFWIGNKRILDPCCGNGNFGAYCMFKTDIDNIWFNDINDIRLDNCRKILRPKNIIKEDYLSMKTSNWDLIMGNPPYSGGGNKNQSISNLFIEKSIELLNDGGYLCFVTPNNWMTYNNNNTTLKKLLARGSFLIINNDIHKYFSSVGSSFTVFIWQKAVFDHKTKVINNYVIKDEKTVSIPRDIPFIPLYISNESISLVERLISKRENRLFHYRCDLHNFTQKKYLSDEKTDEFKYETIHTARKTRYASKKQDIYDKWVIIVPLSTYYIPFIRTNVNVTQSVGYIASDSLEKSQEILNVIVRNEYKTLIHLTRYGNFNNIMVLKHIKFKDVKIGKRVQAFVDKICNRIKY